MEILPMGVKIIEEPGWNLKSFAKKSAVLLEQGNNVKLS